MNHWMCDDKSPVLPLRDLRPMSDGRPRERKGDLSLVSQKGSNYFLWIDPNNLPRHREVSFEKKKYLRILSMYSPNLSVIGVM